MRTIGIRIIAPFLVLAYALSAQQNPGTTVPRLMRITNTFRPSDGQTPAAVESVTLSIYRDEQGGSALWQETQNVAVDSEGRYNLLMGSTLNDGVPVELFSSSEPRWLGVKFNRAGEIEQPRTRLASVPYALKASDAETLGGRPASEYLLAAPAGGATASATGASIGAKPKATPATSGVPGYIGVFTDSTDLGDSAMYQSNGNIGIGTTSPITSLDARTSPFSQIGMAQTTDYLTFFASDQYGPAIYWDPAKDMRFGKGGTGLYNAFGFAEQMRIQSSTGNVGIGTQTPGQMLDVAGNINMTGALYYQGSKLLSLPTGARNLATGEGAGAASGSDNTSYGYNALDAVETGSYNTAVGSSAGAGVGSYNTAVGFAALGRDISENNNTALGAYTLYEMQSGGSYNTAVGYAAGYYLGGGSYNIDIANEGASGDSGVIRIGTLADQTQFFAAGIAGATVSGVPVLVNTGTGQLGVASSSRRFKEDIQDMGNATDGLTRLRPVTFRYKQPFDDGTKPIQYGLIAEEVAEVYPDLVARSADGQIETVRYQVLAPMLLNEVQKQQAEIKTLREQLADQRRQLDLQKQQADVERQRNDDLQQRLSRIEAALATDGQRR